MASHAPTSISMTPAKMTMPTQAVCRRTGVTARGLPVAPVAVMLFVSDMTSSVRRTGPALVTPGE